MNNQLTKKFYNEQWFFESVMNHIDISVTVTNLDEEIIFVNNSAEKLFGYSREELIGKHPSITNVEKNADNIQHTIYKTVVDGRAWHGVLKNRRKNGEVFLLDLTVSPMIDDNGGIVAFIGFQKDVTEIEDARQRLEFFDTKYRSIFETAPTTITLADENGIIIDCNDRIEDLLGYPKDEIINENFRKWVHPEHYDQAQNQLEGLIANEDTKNVEYKFVKKDGSIIDASVNCTSIRGADGEFIHTICFLTDITESKKAERAIREVAEELQHSNEELGQFAYVASHDLQEPLRVVSSYCQLIRDKCIESDHVDEESSRYFEYIIDATDRMKTLIKELLDFSRVGRKDRPFERIDLNDLMSEVLKDFELTIKETGAKIIVEDKLPVIFAIRFRIKQLLFNIISNALKFKSEESPLIRIGCCDDEGVWLFYVKDNGVGIESQYFERIFGIFKRLYSREEYPGTGIGLALCKRIVETHGGNIWVDSTQGQGTWVYFTIPRSEHVKNWHQTCEN